MVHPGSIWVSILCLTQGCWCGTGTTKVTPSVGPTTTRLACWPVQLLVRSWHIASQVMKTLWPSEHNMHWIHWPRWRLEWTTLAGQVRSSSMCGIQNPLSPLQERWTLEQLKKVRRLDWLWLLSHERQIPLKKPLSFSFFFFLVMLKSNKRVGRKMVRVPYIPFLELKRYWSKSEIIDFLILFVVIGCKINFWLVVAQTGRIIFVHGGSFGLIPCQLIPNINGKLILTEALCVADLFIYRVLYLWLHEMCCFGNLKEGGGGVLQISSWYRW